MMMVKPLGCAIDPFMGSGTTGVACVRMGRRFIGVAVQRIEQAFADQVLFTHDQPKAESPSMFEPEVTA